MFDLYELKPMALESNSAWITQEQHKNNEQHLFVTETVHSRPPPKVSNKQHTQTERFTQTEYRGNCVEVVAAVSHKDSVMFEHHQPVQMYSTIEKKDISPDKGSNVTEFPFCYNVNMLQKVHQTQAHGGSPTAAAVASITSDDKTCYRLDVSQPFGYNYALVNQMSLAAAASTATFKCDVCGLVFAHLSLLNHHKRIHTNSDNLSPEKTFSNEQPDEIKAQLKPAAKSLNCNRCGEEVVGCEHTNSKKKASKFVKCENCQSVSNSSTAATSTNGSYPSSPPPSDDTPEIINIPNKGLHLIKRHNGIATVTKCHKCNGSGIIFIGGTKPPTIDKPFRCNVCDGSFSRYSSLWSHKRLHTGDKPFKCEMCGLTFARAAYLKNHLRVHSGEKPYKCNVCGMQFSQSPHLKNHERIHSGERPYQCEVCEKTFARHSTLWNHRRIHTGEKPYRCSVCGSAFNQATHLKNHAKVHTGEKPHRCDICEVGFSDRFALKRHRLVHEKYCRNTSNSSQAQSQQSLPPSQNQQQTSQIEMYKCEVAFPGQQPNASSNSQQQPQQTDQVELYKCEVATTVAFPGTGTTQQSHQPNSVRSSQSQGDVYKCDAGTSVSFPVQQQQTQQSTSDNPPSKSQSSISEVYKVSNNNLSYQNQSRQQTSEISELYKYDVGNSIPYSSQGQQTPQSSSAQPPSSSAPPQQIAQYDVGTSTVSFPGQNQQATQQSSLPTSSQQMPATNKMGSSSYSNDQDTILGP